MWRYEHAVETTASAEAVWRLYSDVGMWTVWDHGLERISLDGPFVAGSRGEMVFQGQPPLAFVLTEVRPGEGFVDETTVPNVGTICFRHTLAPNGDGGTRIVHAVEIDGPAGEAIGPRIVAGVPATMAALARLAEGT